MFYNKLAVFGLLLFLHNGLLAQPQMKKCGKPVIHKQLDKKMQKLELAWQNKRAKKNQINPIQQSVNAEQQFAQALFVMQTLATRIGQTKQN